MMTDNKSNGWKKSYCLSSDSIYIHIIYLAGMCMMIVLYLYDDNNYL